MIQSPVTNERLVHVFLKKRCEILSYFRIRTKDSDVAEDLTQELFVRLWLRKDKLGHVASLSSYVNRMASNMVIDHYNSKGVHERATKYLKITGAAATVDDHCEHQDSLAYADRIVRNLTPGEQVVFRMSCEEGDNVKAIAKRLNKNQFYVKRTMSKAKAKVRDRLKSHLQYGNSN